MICFDEEDISECRSEEVFPLMLSLSITLCF